MADKTQGSKPFDFDELRTQAEEGQLDFIVAYKSSGEIVDYSGSYGEERVVDLRSGPSSHLASEIKFIASSSVYWYCDRETKTWWKCRVQNGVEVCKNSQIPCNP